MYFSNQDIRSQFNAKVTVKCYFPFISILNEYAVNVINSTPRVFAVPFEEDNVINKDLRDWFD